MPSTRIWQRRPPTEGNSALTENGAEGVVGTGDESLRGTRRTGKIGRIIPGDDREVARQIELIWWKLSHLGKTVVRVEAAPCDCEGGGCGDFVVVGGVGAPAYQNSWTGDVRYRFANDDISIEGSVTGGANGTVVFTLPVGERPSIDLDVVGVDDDGNMIRWHVDSATGEVTYSLAAGNVGPTGDTGPQGDPGPPGPQGPPSLIWRGTWSGATAYEVNDVVALNGSSYVCIAAHTNHTPPNGTYWELVAERGDDGNDAGLLFNYDNGTSGDPGSGAFGFNTTTIASINNFRISETDADGNAMAAYIATLDDSTSTARCTVVVRKVGDPDSFIVFAIGSAITDSGAYDSFSIAYVASGGSFADGDPCRLQFVRTGDKGDTGAAGASGKTTLYDSGHLISDTANIDTGAGGVAGGYTMIEIWFWGRTDNVNALTTCEFIFNNDTAGNYDRTLGSAGVQAAANFPFNCHGSGGRANRYSQVMMTWPHYANTSYEKSGMAFHTTVDGTANGTSAVIGVAYRSTSAISRIKVQPASGTGNLKAGSRLIVYGIS